MIIITGPGRAGTSAIAAIYKELGFDPGGRWFAGVSAGYEERDLIRLNRTLKRELKFSTYRLPGARGKLLRRVPFGSYGQRFARPHLIDWRRLDRVLEGYGDAMRDFARYHNVVKDPDMSWLLPVYAAAGAEINYVVVCLRSSLDMVGSRYSAGLTEYPPHQTRNLIVYGLGILMATLYDYDIPHGLARFEEWIEKPEALFMSLRFPESVAFDQFKEAYDMTIDPDRIRGYEGEGRGYQGEGQGWTGVE
jgi:hypothetical protein